MTLLDKIKEEYAKELHCQDWIELLMEINIKREELDVHDEIAKRYAKAVLERAAENVKISVKERVDGTKFIAVIKESILNTKLD